MSAIDDLPKLSDVINQYGLAAKKSLGQNFLFDLNLTQRIAKQAGDLTNHTVIEIGPGPGGLTRAILASGAKKLIVIERDPRCMPALEEISNAYPGKLEIIEGDALEIDIATLADRPSKVIANLPYNVATPLLLNWITCEDWPPSFSSLTLMFQKEVAERICAVTGEKPYGRLGVISNWRLHTEIAFDVSPKAFTPPPKVMSSIVNLIPRKEPLECDRRSLENITKLAFGQRRKMLRASLKQMGGAELLAKAGIEETLRAEQLPVADFVKLANSL